MVPLIALVALAVADPAGDIAAKQSQAASVKSELDSLNSQLEAKVESYNYANVQLGDIQNRIQENEETLKQTTQTLAETQDRLNTRIAAMYRDGSVDMLDVLMNTSDISEFLTKYDMLEKVGEQDRNDIEQVKQLKAQVEDAQVKLDSDKASQEQLVNQLASDKSEIESGVAQRQQMLSGIQGEIAQLQAQEAAQQQAALQAAVSAQSNNSDSSDSSDGGGSGGYGPPPPARAGDAVSIAMTYLGVPYVWGGASRAGVDCSGLVMVVYAQLGISLPHSAAAQYSAGTPISYGDLQPGDLVFYGDGGISHVAIYIGGGQIIQAPFEGEVVQISPISGGGSYRGACRL